MTKFRKPMNLKKLCPIYINTINIFRPLKTWLYNILLHWYNIPHKFPSIKFKFYHCSFEELTKKFYTWYWWDHPYIWNFKKKWIIILIDDVQYKYTYRIKQLESVPFILIRICEYNLLIKFNAPKEYGNYEYWEKMKENS